LLFRPEAVLYEVLGPWLITERSVEKLVGAPREKEPTITVTGRLKTEPREGRPDSRGNPTAWARLTAHEEGREDAHLYSATFHRHTAKIALGLEREAQITVQGYAHLSEDPGAKRLDTISVVNILNYSGKPAKQSE